MSDDRSEERIEHGDEGVGDSGTRNASDVDGSEMRSDGGENRDDAESGHEHVDHADHDGHDHDHEHGHDDHDHHAGDVETVSAAVVTVSSTRTLDEDPSGDAIEAAFEDAGHEVCMRELVNDEYDNVQTVIDGLVDRADIDAVVTTGGTGITPDDVTIEAVDALFKKTLPGFGELFRRQSYEEVGNRAVATRATAGIVSEVPVFCLPGSENAARLGAESIVTDVVGHLAGLARRDDETD